MSSQKIGSIKVPPFDRVNYNLWKKKMTLYIRAANPKYEEYLRMGPFVPMKIGSRNHRGRNESSTRIYSKGDLGIL